ncbi:hypothetical protein DM01DRAFT_1241518 [Hesseltinella vesiculosa]|uniref:Uncharacterized protein n=1 Tax=Hesseltinella vesiculosa TaxID=101127 RepID=A0A1X2G203_9FUNG|nr:hypothetical protein DM01DRAFT_1241518 [Hesseltinella vesiculosa]
MVSLVLLQPFYQEEIVRYLCSGADDTSLKMPPEPHSLLNQFSFFLIRIVGLKYGELSVKYKR